MSTSGEECSIRCGVAKFGGLSSTNRTQDLPYAQAAASSRLKLVATPRNGQQAVLNIRLQEKWLCREFFNYKSCDRFIKTAIVSSSITDSQMLFAANSKSSPIAPQVCKDPAHKSTKYHRDLRVPEVVCSQSDLD
ncbi:hypothetical protein SEVIR_4G275650v4 [Setaria viridis]